jgi:hypothetical protein
VIQVWIKRGLTFWAALVFLLTPFWIRIPTDLPYFLGFALVIPMALGAVCWVTSGFGNPTAWEQLAPFLLPWLMFIPFGFFSQRWANFPEPAGAAALQLLAFGAWVLIIATARIKPRHVAWVLALSVGLHGAVTIAQAVAQRPLGLGFQTEYIIRPGVKLNTLEADSLTYLRPQGLTVHPNMIGGFLTIGLLVGAGLFASGNLGRRQRWLLGSCLAVGWLALLTTFSRAAWIGLFVGTLGFLALCALVRLRLAWRRDLVLATVCLMLAIGFVIAYRPFVFARTLAGDTSSEQRSVVDRAFFLEYTTAMIQQKPLLGVGIGMNDWEEAQMIVADERQPALTALPVHNVPLLIWSELGTVGFALWLLTLAGAGFQLLRYLRRGGTDPVIFGLLAAFVGMLITSQFDFYMWRLFPFAVLWYGVLALALSAMVSTPEIE